MPVRHEKDAYATSIFILIVRLLYSTANSAQCLPIGIIPRNNNETLSTAPH